MLIECFILIHAFFEVVEGNNVIAMLLSLSYTNFWLRKQPYKS